MPWGPFAIALLVVYLIQTGVAALFGFVYFDAFLVLALLCGLLAPSADARLGAWLVGLAQDLDSADALGIHAFALGLTALLLTWLREVLNLGLWWVRLLALVLAGWAGQVIYLTYGQYWIGRGESSFGGLLVSAALTAALAAGLVMLICALPGRRRSRRWRQGPGTRPLPG